VNACIGRWRDGVRIDIQIDWLSKHIRSADIDLAYTNCYLGVIILFEQTFKNVDDTLRKDAGCSSELDYIEQTSWILFLKYLDDLEKDRQTAAELKSKQYLNIIASEFR